ncbi:MAG: HlyD family secretion protein [Gammaproteobacteria bacterium]
MKAINKRAAILALVATVVSGGGWFAWQWYAANRYLETTDDAYVRADTVDVRPEVSGRIVAVSVRENQIVHKGQPLVKIDPGDFRARYRQQQARLDVAWASLADVSEQIGLQQKKVDQARAGVEGARAELRRATLELRRARALERKSYGSKQRLQNARAAYQVAKAGLRKAQAELAAARQMRAVLRAQRSRAKAGVESDKAALAYAKRQLTKTTIRAPSDGVVGDLGARRGAMAQPQVTLLRLVPIHNVYVTANYKETQIARMSIGQPVTLHVDALPDVTFHGVVESLAPATGTQFSLLPTDNATGNFNKIVQRVPVRIRVTGPKASLARLRPGLSVVPAVDTRRFHTQLSYLADSQSVAERSRAAARH